MAKVFIASLLIELDDDAPQPCEEHWARILMQTVPGIEGLGCITFQQRPHDSMEDDPLTHTHH